MSLSHFSQLSHVSCLRCLMSHVSSLAGTRCSSHGACPRRTWLHSSIWHNKRAENTRLSGHFLALLSTIIDDSCDMSVVMIHCVNGVRRPAALRGKQPQTQASGNPTTGLRRACARSCTSCRSSQLGTARRESV